MNVDNTSNIIIIIYTKIILSYIKKLKSYHDIGNPHAISDSHSSQCHLTLNPYVAWKGWVTKKKSNSPTYIQLLRTMRGISSSGMQPQSMRHGHISAYHSAPCIVFQTERISCVAASLLAVISADGRWAILDRSVAVFILLITTYGSSWYDMFWLICHRIARMKNSRSPGKTNGQIDFWPDCCSTYVASIFAEGRVERSRGCLGAFVMWFWCVGH